MARRYDSEAVRNRVLSTSVRLFLERGYHGTTMAAILKEADVSSSSRTHRLLLEWPPWWCRGIPAPGTGERSSKARDYELLRYRTSGP